MAVFYLRDTGQKQEESIWHHTGIWSQRNLETHGKSLLTGNASSKRIWSMSCPALSLARDTILKCLQTGFLFSYPKLSVGAHLPISSGKLLVIGRSYNSSHQVFASLVTWIRRISWTLPLQLVRPVYQPETSEISRALWVCLEESRGISTVISNFYMNSLTCQQHRRKGLTTNWDWMTGAPKPGVPELNGTSWGY